MKHKGEIFWGFLLESGEIEVVKYTNDRKIQNVEQLPFVKGIFEPFRAPDIWEARKMINLRYKAELN